MVTSDVRPWATIGMAVWRAAGYAWFFLGSLFIFLVNGATATQEWGFLAGNFAEVVFVLCLLAAERYFGRVTPGSVR